MSGNKTAEKQRIHEASPPDKTALELFKERLLDQQNTEQELSLLGLHLDVTQQADCTQLINQLLQAQEVGNQSLSAEDISTYTNHLLAFGEQLTLLPPNTPFPANLLQSIRNKEDLTALGVTESDKNGLQDALEIATITLATEAVGPIYALLFDQTYPERRTIGFNAATIENEFKKVVISTPSDLEQLINTKGIKLSTSTQILLNQIAHPTNPLTNALAGQEFTSIVETTKAGFLHLAKTYAPIGVGTTEVLTQDLEGIDTSIQEITPKFVSPDLSRGEPPQIALPPFTTESTEQELPENRDAGKIDALISEMSNAEAKKAYETYMQELSKEQVEKTKQHVQAQEEEKSEAIASRWTENDLDTKLTTAYTTVFTEVYAREEFTALLKEAGEEIKQLITTNSLALPTTKSAIQEILHKKVEEKMQTPEKTARIQQRIQEEVEKIQLTIQHPTTQNELTQKNPTDLPLRLRGTTGTGSSTNPAPYIPQGVISSTDSRSASLPAGAYTASESTPKTVALAAVPHSGNGLVGIFAGLGIVFGTLYLANKADTPPAEGTEASGSFWGKMGKMGLIGLALAGGAYGSYRAYDYFVNGKKGGNAQGGSTTTSNGAESTTAPLYPIPNGQTGTAATTNTNSTSGNESSYEGGEGASNNTQTRTPEEETSGGSTTTQSQESHDHDDNNSQDDTTSDNSENAPVPETVVLPKTIPGPETGEILTEEQQQELADANKDKIAELSARKTALDGTKKIEEALEGEHGKRVAKMYSDIVTHTGLKLNNDKERKRKAGDTVCIIDPERNPKVMYLIEDGGVIKGVLPITPGKNGIGNESGSEKTSTGIMLFSPSEITGTSTDTANPDVLGQGSIKDEDGNEYHKAGTKYRPGDRAHHQITGRRMPLYGLEEKNHNAYARGIYCHGTNNPQELGYATSQGCIRISNADAIQLADYIKAKTAKKQQVFLGVIE